MMYMEKGGIVNVSILLVCVISLYLGFDRLFVFLGLKRAKKVLAALLQTGDVSTIEKERKKDWLVSWFIDIYAKNSLRSSRYFYNRFRELLIEKVPEMERGLDIMAAWISIAPLLGLLGTVVGMVQTFSTITLFGVGNPNLLSEGISVALITTQSGLIVAFPCLLFHNYLLSMKNALVKEILADVEKLLNWAEKRSA